jgi:hypothetical protein
MPGILPGVLPSIKAFCRASRCSGAAAAAAPMSPGVTWWRAHMAAAPGISPGVKTQRRSRSCSANVPRHDVVAAHAWLQGRQDAAA